MRGIIIGASLAMLGLSPVAVRAEDSVGPERISGLIQNLSSPKFLERDRANRELRRLGEPALKQLKSSLDSRDYEVRERVALAIQFIEQKLANDRLLLAPTIRLKFDKMPLDQAIAEVAKLTGIQFKLDPKSTKDPNQAITLDTGEVPYWEGVEQFLAVAGLTEVALAAPANTQPQPYYEQQQLGGFRGRPSRGSVPATDSVIRLIEGKSPLSASTATLIRVKALPRESQNSGSVKGSSHIVLNLEVTPAPTLLWQGVVNVDARKVVDDRGIALAQSHTHNPASPNKTVWMDGMQAQVFQGGQRQVIIQGNVQIWSNVDGMPNPGVQVNPRHVPIALLTKDSTSKVLKELHGVITAEVLTPPEAIVTIDDILKVKAKESTRKNDYQMAIEDRVDNANGSISYRVRVRMPAQNFLMQMQGRRGGFAQVDSTVAAQPNLQLQDAAGKAIAGINMQIMEQSFDGITQTSLYTFVVPAKNTGLERAKLAVVGRRIATVEVPFSLKDVPLP